MAVSKDSTYWGGTVEFLGYWCNKVFSLIMVSLRCPSGDVKGTVGYLNPKLRSKVLTKHVNLSIDGI